MGTVSTVMPAFIKVGETEVEISKVRVTYIDGKTVQCEGSGNEFVCEKSTLIRLRERGSGNSVLLGLEATSLTPFSSEFAIHLSLGLRLKGEPRVLTTTPLRGPYGDAYKYYSGGVAIDRTPQSPPPPDNAVYPPAVADLSHDVYLRNFPCWCFPVLGSNYPNYSVFMLAETQNGYLALATLSNGDTTAFLGRGNVVSLYTGKSVSSIGQSWFLALSWSNDPYSAVRGAVEVSPIRPRWEKAKPSMLNGLGWCSWNALMLEDLREGEVLRIVKGLMERGVKLSWALIDDGWQDEVKRDGLRIMKGLGADPAKFPKGLSNTVRELKSMGLKVGLWHTLNAHWGGVTREFLDQLGVEGFYAPGTNSYVPPPWGGDFFDKFESWVRDQGFDFVKVDNQWVIHAVPDHLTARAGRAVQLALQNAVYSNRMDLINCMSMSPDDYCNYVHSNVMRTSEDYVPFWKGGAKFHLLFNAYNTLPFSNITYPDYDMLVTYDPYAKAHAVARVFSGGPIYLSDRHPEKTDVGLIRSMTLPWGEVVRVDEPSLPTRDVLFRDPYNDGILLKLAGRVRGVPAVALFNVDREGREVEDEVRVDSLPFKVEGERVFYKVFSGQWGSLRQGEGVKVRLRELETEVILFPKVVGGKAVIGIEGLILPPYPIEVLEESEKAIKLRSAIDGKLVSLAQGQLKQTPVLANKVVEL